MKFTGFPIAYKNSKYEDLKAWFNKSRIKKRHPDLDFDKEFKKIGGVIETKKKKES